MDPSDWKSQLLPDSRRRIADNIMKTLKRVLPVSGDEGLIELKKMAESIEEKIYSAATSLSDYMRKISLEMLTMETKYQNRTMGNSFPSISMVLSNKPLDCTSLDSTTQSGQDNGGDWQEEIYQKIKAMKDLYFIELTEMYEKVLPKLDQVDSNLAQPKIEQLNKLRAFKGILERFLSFLQVQKSSIDIGFKDQVSQYERQIVSFLNYNRPRNSVSQPQMTQG